MSRLVSRAEFSRLLGISRTAVTKLCQGKLKSACVDDRVDIDAPAAKAYVAAQDAADALSAAAKMPVRFGRRKSTSKDPVAPTEPVGNSGTADTDATPAGPYPRPDESGLVDELSDWTLGEIIKRYGTVRAYKDHLEAHEKRERALKNRLANEQTMGNLVERERVETHVFGIIDGGNKRLLRDVPKNLAARIHAAVKADSSIEEIEAMIRDGNSSVLRPVRDTVLRNLKRRRRDTQGPE